MIGLGLNMVAIAGLALAGFGVFMAAQAVSRNDSVRGGALITVIGVLIAIVFFVMSAGVIEIQPQEVGVVFNVLSGELSETALDPGLHIIIPGIQDVTIYSVSQQEYTVSGATNEGAVRGDDAIIALTKDGQEVSLDVTMIYSINPAKAYLVHQRWQERYVNGLIRTTLRSEARNGLSQYSVEEIYSGDRADLMNTITESIRNSIEPEGFTLSSVKIRNIKFSDDYVASIERKQVAQQEALEAEFRVEQKKQEAEQARETARGEADAAKIRAEGEAEALRLINEQLAANPLLLQWRYIDELGGNVQLMIIPSNSPFLFDLEQLTQTSGGLSTPATTGSGN